MRLAKKFRQVQVGLSLVVAVVALVQSVAEAQTAPFSASRPNNPPAPKNAPRYHGQVIRLPEMPFARQRAASGKPATNSRAMATRQAPRAIGQQPSYAARPQSGVATPARQYGAASRGALIQSSARTQPAARPVMAPSARPTATASHAAQLTPKSPAEQLVAQAHQLSASARSEADYTNIIETSRRASTSQPDPAIARYATDLSAWALNRRGQLKADSGRDAEALRDFEDAVAANPNRWRAIHNRGVLLAQDAEFARAFDDFNRTIQLQPKFAKAYSNRAALFEVAGKLPQALADFERAIELDPNLAVAHRGRGRACHLLGRLDEALRHYDVAVRLAPDDAFAAASRAAVLTDVGRYREAADGYENAIKLDPNSSYALGGSAWLLATCPDDSVRNPRLAIDRAEAAIKLTGGNEAASYDTLAAAQANAGNYTAAIHSIRRAVDMAPSQERAIYQDRMLIYESAKPYRIAPVDSVTQTSFHGD
jgi:tetratricopeptide (TPR) repeat protein